MAISQLVRADAGLKQIVGDLLLKVLLIRCNLHCKKLGKNS